LYQKLNTLIFCNEGATHKIKRMKALLVINTADLAAIKISLRNETYLLDKLNDAEVSLEEPHMLAIFDMLEDAKDSEYSFVFNEDYDEDIKY